MPQCKTPPIVRRRAAKIFAAIVVCCLGGCGTINEKIASGAGDYVPQWAGGLPADAPPRPGTPKYDAYMQELQRRRAMPATEREQIEKKPDPALDPVH